MITLFLIGIGTGNPDHLTGQAITALNAADLILIPRKGEAKSDLADVRRTDPVAGPDRARSRSPNTTCRPGPIRTDYLGAVNDWHDAIAQVWADTIAAACPAAATSR